MLQCTFRGCDKCGKDFHWHSGVLVLSETLAELRGHRHVDHVHDGAIGSARATTTAVSIGRKPAPVLPAFDLLNLPRPPARAPWAYVKVAEGCDKACGFCAIPNSTG